MNIYFICPKDFEPGNFHTIIELLKVKIILNLIPKDAGINPEDYIDGEKFENICYEDLSYIPVKPQYSYIPKVAHEICNYIIPEGYSDILGYINEDDDMPFPQSKTNDFIANLKYLDDPNILIFFKTRISDIARNIYKELFKVFQSREMENRIPILLFRSWASYPEGNIVDILRKMTKEEIQSTSFVIKDPNTGRHRRMTPAEKKRASGLAFNPLDLKEIHGKYSYYPHGDPLCYLYYSHINPLYFNYEDLNVKIKMAKRLFTKEALQRFDEKLDEIAQRREQEEYMEWLHADDIDDTDYERETFLALGGDDYD